MTTKAQEVTSAKRMRLGSVLSINPKGYAPVAERADDTAPAKKKTHDAQSKAGRIRKKRSNSFIVYLFTRVVPRASRAMTRFLRHSNQ